MYNFYFVYVANNIFTKLIIISVELFD